MKKFHEVVVLGAGYAGLVTTLQLQKSMKDEPLRVTLVNKHDYHYFTTQLHKPAAGTDHHDQTRVQIMELLDLERVYFIKGSVKAIYLEDKVVELNDRTLPYDQLIIGLGSDVETFGIPGLEEHALTIRSINSVRLIRQHIQYMFAKYKMDPKRTDYLTIIVGGAGFTGTEFVGELADSLPMLCKEFDVSLSKVKIYNVEAAPTALPPGLPKELVDEGMRVLEKKGVIYKLSTPIQACTEDGVQLGDGTFIASKTVIWSGGVRGNTLVQAAGFETVRGRVQVDAYMRSLQYPDVFVAGDCSIVFGSNGKPLPANAQLAVQQGYVIAKNVLRTVRGELLQSFQHDNKGTVASLGKGAGVGIVKGKAISGKFAALVKRIVDARYLYLIGGLPLVIKKGGLTFRG